MSWIQWIQVQSPTSISGSELSGTPASAEPMPSSGRHRYKYTSNAHTYTHLKINLKKEEAVPLELVKRLREQKHSQPELNPGSHNERGKLTSTQRLWSAYGYTHKIK